MTWKVAFCILILPFSVFAKEWKCLKQFQEATQFKELSPSDWLASDRRNNTVTWQNANTYNLTNNQPEAYETIKQRRDFYSWITSELKKRTRGRLATNGIFYLKKLRLLEAFPFSLMTSKKMKTYAREGSVTVFNESFEFLKSLLLMDVTLGGEHALAWDKAILHDEQFIWIESVYKTMDARSLKRIERIAKGKCIYGLFVPKAIRFTGDISNADDRYDFALDTLRVYVEGNSE